MTHTITRVRSLLAWAASNVPEILLNDIELLTWLPTHISLSFDVAVTIGMIIHTPIAAFVLIAHCSAIFDRVDIVPNLDSFSQEIRVGAELIAHAACASVYLLAIGTCVESVRGPKQSCCGEQRCCEKNHMVC
jgi:hypothetical protein